MPLEAPVAMAGRSGEPQPFADAAGPGVAGVLGDDGAGRDVRRDVGAATAGLRQHGEFLQYHAQFRLHRHHGAWHDDGHCDRRHRPVGRLGDGPRRDRRRLGLAGWRTVVAGDERGAGNRPCHRRGERGADRLARSAAIRGDTRHAVDRPLACGGAVAEQDDLRLRPGCRHDLRDRRRTGARHRQSGLGTAGADRGVLRGAASYALGTPSLRHRRQ